MKLGKIISIILFIISLMLVFQFNSIANLVTQNNFKIESEVTFNSNSDFENRATLVTTSKSYVVLDKNVIEMYDSKGTPIWSKPLSSQNTVIASGNKRIAVAEKKAGDIFILDEYGEIQASLLGIGALANIKLFEDQILGVVKADGVLNLYDEKLNLLGMTKLPSGEMVDFDVNIEKQDIIMGILDLSRTDFNSKLVIAGFNGNIISGSNLIQDVILDIIQMKNAFWVVTDNAIRIYDYDSNLLNEVVLDRLINNIYYDANLDTLYLQLMNDASQLDNPKSKHTLVSYNAEGNLIYDVDLNIDDCKGLKRFNDYLCLYNNEELYFIDDAGHIAERYRGEDEIKDVLLTHSNTFGIVYDNRMSIYTAK